MHQFKPQKHKIIAINTNAKQLLCSAKTAMPLVD